MQWQLDESAQTALLQLDPAMQAKVVAEFSPKPGTRDVNRLFHGFLRSMQTGHPPPPHRQGGGAGAAAAAAAAAAADPFTALYSDGPAAVDTGAYGAGVGNAAAEHQNATLLTQLYQTELGVDPARLQDFCQTWGLDEGAQTALLQLEPQVQAQVMQDFAPKPHTQDINRLFHGFMKSVGNRAVPGARGAATSQASDIGAAITESLAAQGGYVPPSARRNAGAPGVAGMGHYAVAAPPGPAATAKRLGTPMWGSAEDAPPGPDEVASFLMSWGLDSACGAALEGQSGEVQRRILEQFRPRDGTRDVRSLFYGFIKSVASGGGGKRPRGELQAPYVPDDFISA